MFRALYSKVSVVRVATTNYNLMYLGVSPLKNGVYF